MPQTPLNTSSLKELTLRYISRYATTRHRLAVYLRRKVRERGWDGEPEAEAAIEALLNWADNLGAVDDAAFARSRVRSLGRRGLGSMRVRQALAGAGIEQSVAEEALSDLDALEAAAAYLRRRRWGPYGQGAPFDQDARRKAFAAMMRAGHRPDLARTLLRLTSEEELEALRQETSAR